MRARPPGVLMAAGATCLVVLLTGCNGTAAHHSAAAGTPSTAATDGSTAAAQPSASASSAARSGGTATPTARSGASSAPSSAAKASASPGGKTGGPDVGGPSAQPASDALTVSTACRKPASTVGTGLALPHTKPAPFTATRTDCNGTLDFSSYTQGKPTLVTFFASWCEPCHKEAANLEAVYQEYHASKGFQVIAVDTQDESGSPSWFYTNAKWSFPAVWDDKEKIEKAWNQSGATSTLPASFWIHPDGTISSIDSGEMSRSKMEAEFKQL